MTRWRRTAAVTLVLTVCGVLSGCYRHVVRAEGPAGRNAEIHEPALDEDEHGVVEDLEDALLGPEEQSQH